MMPLRLATVTSILYLLLFSACCHAQQARSGDIVRGKAAIEHYGCVACHVIPGIANPGSNIGPPLKKIGTRSYIAGVLPNSEDNMIQWLRNPQQVDPRTAMPDVGVTERDARDMAAYLDTLK